MEKRPRVMAGIPAVNKALYHRIRFAVGDPAAIVDLPNEAGDGYTATLIVRDIEMVRAREEARADKVACPADFTPDDGLSGDRETATAQATAECLRRAGAKEVVTDRTLPYSFAYELQQAGIAVQYDSDFGVGVRRAKDAEEVEHLRHCQRLTEDAIEMACRWIAGLKARLDGVLAPKRGNDAVTSDHIRKLIDVFLLERGFTNPMSIVACGPQGAICHNHGHGELRSGEPIIIDVFPCDRASLYHGDCTRTVVHGEILDELARMHAVVVEAKAAAIAATRAGATGEDVHKATIAVIQQHGYAVGLPGDDDPDTYCGMVHGTGHGVGLDVHEPPLLDFKGPPLVTGDCLTIEPGLYSRAIGGVRVEDMVIVTEDGCENLNSLPEGLDWS